MSVNDWRWHVVSWLMRSYLDGGRTICDIAMVVYDCSRAFANRHSFCVWLFFFFSSRRRHTRLQGDWSSDVCSSDLDQAVGGLEGCLVHGARGRDALPGLAQAAPVLEQRHQARGLDAQRVAFMRRGL